MALSISLSSVRSVRISCASAWTIRPLVRWCCNSNSDSVALHCRRYFFCFSPNIFRFVLMPRDYVWHRTLSTQEKCSRFACLGIRLRWDRIYVRGACITYRGMMLLYVRFRSRCLLLMRAIDDGCAIDRPFVFSSSSSSSFFVIFFFHSRASFETPSLYYLMPFKRFNWYFLCD